MRRFLAVLPVLALTACAGSPERPQGTTHASATIDPSTGIKTVEIHDGKDRGGLTANYAETRPDGSSIRFSLTENDINGSVAQGQALQASTTNTGKALDVIGSLIPAAMKLAPIPVPKP